MLVVESLSKQLADKPVLKEISFTVNENDRLAIIGPSGSGKTTLLKCLAGLLPIDHGKITWQDRVFTDSDIIVPPWNRGISMVFQDLALWSHLTVIQHLEKVFQWAKLEKALRPEKNKYWLKRLELEELTHRFPHQLSGGQQQRLAFARMLAAEPEIALLDEAFNQQDSTLNDKMWTILLQEQENNGMTILFTSHDATQVEKYSTSSLRL